MSFRSSIFTFLLLAFPALAFDCDPVHFEDLLENSSLGPALKKLPPDRQRFLSEVGLKIFGKRLFESEPGKPRELIVADNGVTFKGFGENRDVHFRWVDRISEPYFRIEPNGNRTIFVPKDFEFSLLKNGGQDFFYRAMRGHSLNPFVKSEWGPLERDSHGEPFFIRKEVQQEAIKAGVGSLARGDETFLFVGPTGVGKTIVIEGTLNHFVNETKKAIALQKPGEEPPPKLQIVFANQNHLVDQLAGNIGNMEFAGDVEIIRWGGKDKRSIEEISEYAKKSKKPVILVTTIQTLTERSGRFRDEDTNKYDFEPTALEALKKNVRSITIDEAHHAGAASTIGLLDKIRGIERNDDGSVRSQVTDPTRPPLQIVGVTATPSREDMKFIPMVFEGNAFWGYLDNADDFLAHGAKADRPVSEILKQLEIAIEKGEAHPVKTHFLDPDKFDATGTPLFVQLKRPGEKGSRYQLNPEHYKNFYDALTPILNRHEHLFFSCSNIDEAKALKNFFEDEYAKKPGKFPHKFGVLHSGMSAADQKAVKKAFERGEITALFNVDIMNEGIDIPTLTAYIDTNQNTHPRDLAQRIGRILRLSEGKSQKAEVVSFEKITDLQTADALNHLNAISERNWGEDPTYEKSEPGERTPIVAPETFAPGLVWTQKELREKHAKFFAAERAPNKKTQESFNKITEYIDKVTAFGFTEFDALRPMEPAGRRIHDLLYEMVNSEGRTGESFLYLVQNAKPKYRAPIEKYVRELREREAILKDPVAMAKWVRDNRAPDLDPRNTRDRQAMADAIAAMVSNPVFLAAVTAEKAAPYTGHDINQVMKSRLEKPTLYLDDIFKFDKHHGHLPKPGAKGYEGALAKALDSFVSPKNLSDDEFNRLLEAHFAGNEPLMYELFAKRELLAEAVKPKEAGKAAARATVETVAQPSAPSNFELRDAKTVTSTIAKVRSLIEKNKSTKSGSLEATKKLLFKLERLRDIDADIATVEKTNDEALVNILKEEKEAILNEVAGVRNLALLNGLPANRSATLVLTAAETTGNQKLVQFYTALGNQYGYGKPVAEKKGGSLHLTFTAPGNYDGLMPSQAFAYEAGVHRVQFKQGSNVYTNSVVVSMEGAPGRTGEVRNYSLQYGTPQITDNPKDREHATAIGFGDRTSFESALAARLRAELAQ